MEFFSRSNLILYFLLRFFLLLLFELKWVYIHNVILSLISFAICTATSIFKSKWIKTFFPTLSDELVSQTAHSTYLFHWKNGCCFFSRSPFTFSIHCYRCASWKDIQIKRKILSNLWKWKKNLMSQLLVFILLLQLVCLCAFSLSRFWIFSVIKLDVTFHWKNQIYVIIYGILSLIELQTPLYFLKSIFSIVWRSFSSKTREREGGERDYNGFFCKADLSFMVDFNPRTNIFTKLQPINYFISVCAHYTEQYVPVHKGENWIVFAQGNMQCDGFVSLCSLKIIFNRWNKTETEALLGFFFFTKFNGKTCNREYIFLH